MYQFIPAEAKYLDQMVPLLYETSCYEYTALNNKLNLPAAGFCKQYVLQPYLPYTSVMIDKTNPIEEKFVGFFTTLTKKQLEEVEQNMTYHYRDDPTLVDLFKRLDHSLTSCLSDQDLYAYLGAIHPDYRGKFLLQHLPNHYRALAKKYQCTRIIVLVWQSNPAWKVFKRYGMRYFGSVEFPFLPKPDTLLQGYFEVT